MQSLDDKLKNIRTQCRLAMNGVVSTSMREKGLIYKLNFGLTTQQIKDIANQYDKDKELAERLWLEDSTRELRILATLLYPIDNFSADTANRWAQEIPNQEIREQVCFNLLQELPYANQLAIEWSNNENINLRITGYWLLARLFLAKKIQSHLVVDYFNYIWQDIASDDIFLRNASLLALKHMGRQSKEEADIIIEKLSTHNNSDDLLKAEAYNNVAFEFEFYFGR